MITLDTFAYTILSRYDIADLHATRDAIELADLLIAYADHTDTEFDTDLDDDMIIPELRLIMTNMILNPVD